MVWKIKFERLAASIRAKGARLAVPGVVDLSDLAAEAQGVAKIVLESIQGMLLTLALQMARDDYEDRRERQPSWSGDGIFVALALFALARCCK